MLIPTTQQLAIATRSAFGDSGLDVSRYALTATPSLVAMHGCSQEQTFRATTAKDGNVWPLSPLDGSPG